MPPDASPEPPNTHPAPPNTAPENPLATPETPNSVLTLVSTCLTPPTSRPGTTTADYRLPAPSPASPAALPACPELQEDLGVTCRIRPIGAPCVKTRRRPLGPLSPPKNHWNHKGQDDRGPGGRSYALPHATPERITQLGKPSALDRALGRYSPCHRQSPFNLRELVSLVPVLCFTRAVPSPRLPMTHAHLPPFPAEPPGLPRTLSNIGTLHGNTLHHLLCSRRRLHPPSAMFPSVPLPTPCPICTPPAAHRTPVSSSAFPHRRRLAGTITPPNYGSPVPHSPSRSTYNFDVDHMMYADDVVCPVSPCCIYGSVS